MTSIEWDESLSVGIGLINDQHKMLIEKLNDLATAVDEKKGSERINQTLDFLIDYTEFHFSTEEKHMTEQAYPGIDFHKEQHQEFKTTLNHLLDDFDEEGATVPLADSIQKFLIAWLVKHIRSVDVEFGKFLKEKGMEDLQE